MAKRKLLSKITAEYRNRVRECRLKALIPKQEVLSKKTGIPRSTINALENNKLFLSSQYALIIRDVLGCSLDDLYEKKNHNSK
jgi:DNA-binding XRE family transcriptional regulator